MRETLRDFMTAGSVVLAVGGAARRLELLLQMLVAALPAMRVAAIGSGAVLAVLFAATGATAQVNQIHPDDGRILGTLYNETDGPNWVRCSDYDAFVKGWCGVGYDFDERDGSGSRRATGIELNFNNLTGEIPIELGQLTSLEVLEFEGNNLTGEIPTALGQLVQLDWLSLENNDLSGPIPAALGQLVKLETLVLGFNDLSGPIPAALGQLVNLRSLILWNNDLSGPIPAELGQLGVRLPPDEEFTSIIDHDTGLCFPADFPRDSPLYQEEGGAFGLPDCSDIPNTTTQPDRQALMALYNATNGPNWKDNTNWDTEEPIGSWHGVDLDDEGRVTGLDLAANNLVGSLPPELGNLTSLRQMTFWFNSLTGRIPGELGNLSLLRALNLGTNDFIGSIPPQLGYLGNLEELDLSNNDRLSGPGLTGALPPELGDLRKLDRVNLSQNSLTGGIPPRWGNLVSLTDLNLSWNGLTGRLPRTFLQLAPFPHLVLDISQNAGICVPKDPDFDAWLEESNVTVYGDRCAVAVVAKPAEEVQSNVDAAIAAATDGAGLHTDGVSARVPLDALFTLPDAAALAFRYMGYTFTAESSASAVLLVEVEQGVDRPEVVLTPGAAGLASIKVEARMEGPPGETVGVETVSFDVEVQSAVPTIPAAAAVFLAVLLIAMSSRQAKNVGRREREWE